MSPQSAGERPALLVADSRPDDPQEGHRSLVHSWKSERTLVPFVPQDTMSDPMTPGPLTHQQVKAG